MKNFIFIMLLLSSLNCFGKKLYYIEPGEILKISIPISSNVHISTKKYLMIEDLYSHLKVVGKREGKTVINVGSHIHIIYVVKPTIKDSIHSTKKKLKNMLGLKFILDETTPTITGRLHRLKDWITIRESFGQHEYVFKPLVDKDLKYKILKYFNKDLNNLPHINEISLSPYPKVTYYNIDEKLKSTLKKYFNSWGIQDVEFVENKDFNYKHTVDIALEFYEVSKSASKNYGINWLNNIGYQVAPQQQTIGDLQAQLQMLEGQGDAKLIQRSHLKTANTHSVKFVAGGEIAIPHYSYKSKSVSWKTYGLQLKFTPRIVKERIQIKINAEVSDLHESQSVNGIPGIKTNKYESLLSLEENKPVIISGLIKSRSQNSTEGIMGLSKIPLFGHLFKSKQFVNNNSELIVLLTVKQVN